MTLLHNIRTVAGYEATTLRRSWFFRLFSISALAIFTGMNIGVFSPVGDEDWSLVSFTSSIPHINLYLLNIAQSIVVIFLAADFLKRDKKVDTNEVLYTRSVSNFEYVMGKTLGILRLFIGLDIIILLIGLVINIISKRMSIDLMAYLWYLIIICVPTIIFSLGLAFMLMSVIRNQAITFLLLLGLAATNIFWLWFRFGFIFDYMAFGLPVFRSEVAGFGNTELIINQRLMYFSLGMMLVMATILLFKRLPQSKLHMAVSWSFLIIFTLLSGVCGYNTWNLYHNGISAKNLVIETNRQFEDIPVASLTSAFIEFRHKGDSYEADAKLVFVNDTKEDLASYIFSLNPGLNVSKITSMEGDVSFKRINHIIRIDPLAALPPGSSDSLTISYSGMINEAFCYPDYIENEKESPYRIAMVNVNKRQAFLSNKYVLLTPESHWYPVPALNYYPSNPARIKVDYTYFTLRVKAGEGLKPVAQGIRTFSGDSYLFTPEKPLTGLTLAMGNYLSDTLTVDSLKFISWYFPGNDYYKEDLSELKDTLSLLVSGFMRELETNFSTGYPFPTLNLVEVPVHFYSYPRMSTQTRAELQPSMALLPEKLSTIQNAGFGKQFTRQKKRMERSNQVITDKELQVRLFNNFVRNTFLNGSNFRIRDGQALNEPTRYMLGPSYYFFRNNFYSTEYPVINAVFESHLQKISQPGPGGGVRAMTGGLSDNDKANLILRHASFRDVLALNPGSDTISAVLTVKGDYLFNLLRGKAGIEEFNTWFRRYIENNEFKRIDIAEMNKEISKEFGFEFYPYLDDWFNIKEQPGFFFEKPVASEIVVGDRVRYLVTFVVSNPEKVPGMFNVAFRTGGPGAGRGGGQMMTGVFMGGPGGGGGRGSVTISMQGRGMEASDISRIVEVAPGVAKKIGIILDAQPRAMMINTLFSQNIPGEINIPITEVKKLKTGPEEFADSEIEVPVPSRIQKGEIIVDNEDPGFDMGTNDTEIPLKKILGIKNRRQEGYQQINMFWAPDFWQPVVQSTYYGKYILSSVYTRGGTGDKSVTWKAKIENPGYYDIYCYIGKQTGGRVMVGVQRAGQRGAQGGPPPGGPGAGGQAETPYKDMHYRIHHDEGIEEITVDFENAEGGWNKLGQYYLSPDTAIVELTNQSSGRIVLGDAIRWVKIN
ncbi:MAG TPA: hypothetical protein PLV06_04065 [Bacteroidales bacterium]|nr:hypothetical protein [Bacteroidales bacterium]